MPSMDLSLHSIGLIVGTLVILSMAVERCVEVIKGFVPWIGVEKTDPKKERIRKSVVQGIAILTSGLVVFFTHDAIVRILPSWNSIPKMVVLAIFISGGAGIWNSIAALVLAIKNAKQQIVDG